MSGVAGQRRVRRDATLEERIDFHTDAPTSHGCLPWTGCLDPDGYGRLLVEGRTTRAHRTAYELFHGPIPEGLTLDHLCRVRSCVNPLHLEPVTRRVNVWRGLRGRQ